MVVAKYLPFYFCPIIGGGGDLILSILPNQEVDQEHEEEEQVDLEHELHPQTSGDWDTPGLVNTPSEKIERGRSRKDGA